VTEKRNRWLINIVLIIAVVAFAGLSMAPLLGNAFGRDRTAQAPNDANPVDTTAAARTELETRAKGFELVLQREPDNQTALRGLVDAKIQLGDIKGVIEPLEKLAALNPDQTEYSVLLAQAKQQVGDLEGAAQTYRSVLTERPGDMNALKGLVTLLVAQDRPQAAVGLLQDTLQTADQANKIQAGSIDVTSVKLLLGQVYAEQERYNEAISVYDEAISSNSQDFRPVLAKAIVLQAQGKDSEAQALFTSASALAPAQYKDQINQMAAGNSAQPGTEVAPPSDAAPVEGAPEAEPAPPAAE
jgi:tetratricopeptide (TPR) repeat protein